VLPNSNGFDLVGRLGSVNLTRGDRLIAESAARTAEGVVEVLCGAFTKAGAALAFFSHARARPAG